MGKTQNFGLNSFGSEGRISDEGYKFTSKDRDLIDTLLYTLYQHDHREVSDVRVTGPRFNPELVAVPSGGVFGAGQTWHYVVSFMDRQGNETEASVASTVTTPPPLPSPEAQVLTVATTGGALPPGTYRYALSFYQAAGGETRAPNLSTATIPVGTSTNKVTVPLPALPSGADGWKIYRKRPSDVEYWLLDTVASGPTEYVDDGLDLNLDCTKRRPSANTTNATNSVTVTLSPNDLPLSSRVGAWRLYRTSASGAYGEASLVATVSDTTTEGGAILVTSYTDTGGSVFLGRPLSQTAVPPALPQLDAADVFADSSRPLPTALAPRGLHQFHTFLPGTLAAKTYNRTLLPFTMFVQRFEVFFPTTPTGLSGGNYFTLRLKDDSSVNEKHALFNDAAPRNEVQRVWTTASAGTFTLSFDGQGPTAAIAYNADAAVVKAALEALSNITTVQVAGIGTPNSPWVVTFVNPGNQNVAQMTANSAGLTGGSASVSTSIEGSNGGTFTLHFGGSSTSGIAYNASAATLKTRIETDLSAFFTTVAVTGTGTSSDPWVIEYTNPAATYWDLLTVNDTNLNGRSTISRVQEGRGPQNLPLVLNANQQYFSWASPTTPFGEGQAEDVAPGGGDPVSDLLATNDAAVELDTQNETCQWDVGTLQPGTYTFRFYVSDVDQTSTFEIAVLNTAGPTTLVAQSLTPARVFYEPAYELRWTLPSATSIRLQVKKTNAPTDRVRVDKMSYEVLLPRLWEGQNFTVEVTQTGSPTGAADAQVNVWY